VQTQCKIDLSQDPIWLNINKPVGYSSAKVVAIVKRFTKSKKVGHGGTLDPFASGVLPIALNKATKTSQKMMDAKKRYFFRISWGEFRDSDDIDGEVIESSDARPSREALISILPNFIGKIKQKPSKFSAIKVNGKRAYELARKGEKFDLGYRDVEIFMLKLISNNENFAEFEVECSKGTYIRSLARDIALQAGVCGYVCVLIRKKVGKFLYDKTISLDLLKANINNADSFLDGSLLNVREMSL